jgi:uncharacterized OsmC-like protein
MNADELKSIQAPLKERYRASPRDALVTLRAQGRLADGVSCRIETGKALVVAGLHPATGGSAAPARATCCSRRRRTRVTLNAVATALGIEIRDAALTAEGDLDFRGTLGVSKETPVGFQDIRLRFSLDTDATDEQLETLLRLTERYCVVYQTLRQPPSVTISRTRERSAT